MDNLTQKGLKFIQENENALRMFARIQIANGAQEDDWFGYSMNTGSDLTDMNEKVEETIDVNVWLDVETGKWRAAAYPMEYVRARGHESEIQTNTQDFVELF